VTRRKPAQTRLLTYLSLYTGYVRYSRSLFCFNSRRVSACRRRRRIVTPTRPPGQLLSLRTPAVIPANDFQFRRLPLWDEVAIWPPSNLCSALFVRLKSEQSMT